ncbi:hypothetical protein [Cellulomonas sp. IC4_254]|uniref:hypothetical protein n=1 Tax=Cellulomonas sp. IC4_254 TaxID=2714040 RepID=UPI00141E7246|nr:hypothetical protein [Cellulomonas sp. IC4_254]NHT18497.1 hypothetical protein [Cellulomonas sp. IC4_254]
MTSPTSVLTPPSDADPLPDAVQMIFSAGDLVSPTAWIRWVLDQVCDFDPVEDVARWVSGDWNRVMQASRALTHLGEYHASLAEEIDVARRAVAADWDGEAAEAANTYFATLVTALEEQKSALDAIAGQFQAVAVGMSQTADVLAGLVNSLFDWVIIAAASAAAAAASSWTVIGGIAGGAATAGAIARAASLATQILGAHALATSMASGAVGVIAGYLGALRGFHGATLPSAYDHPGVRS